MADVHLVGETIDPLTAHRMARAGELVQMFRGVYVAAGGDPDEILRAHAPTRDGARDRARPSEASTDCRR